MAFYSLFVPLLFPSGLCFCLLIGALIFSKRKRLATVLLSLAAADLLVFGNGWIVDRMARPLEWKHLPTYPLPKADAIVCLGGGTLAPDIPRPTVEVTEAGDRVTYAAHLYHEGKAPIVIPTGGMWPGTSQDHPCSADIAALLRICGLPSRAIVEQTNSLTTYEDAVFTNPILKERKAKRILLVTSAAHMPRALAVFRKQCPGIEIIAAPTDFMVTRAKSHSFAEILRGCLPSGVTLARADAVLHEYVGYAYYWLRGRI